MAWRMVGGRGWPVCRTLADSDTPNTRFPGDITTPTQEAHQQNNNNINNNNNVEMKGLSGQEYKQKGACEEGGG